MSVGRRVGGGPLALAIVHDIPGRLRVRLPVGARTSGLPDTVRELPGVAACSWSPRTRGLLVRYRPDVTSAQAVARAVAERVEVDDVVADTPENGPVASSGHSVLSVSIARTVGELNRQLGRASHGAFDLAGLVPLTLAAWAIAELLRGRVAPITWSTALWYAHGLFRDYHSPAAER